jgi:uncharacterized protein (DUF3820 family)
MKLPFGKYKGREVSHAISLNHAYMRWLTKQHYCPDYIRAEYKRLAGY